MLISPSAVTMIHNSKSVWLPCMVISWTRLPELFHEPTGFLFFILFTQLFECLYLEVQPSWTHPIKQEEMEKSRAAEMSSAETQSHKDGGLLRPLLSPPRVRRPANLFLRSEGPCLPSSSHSEIMLPLQGSAGLSALVAVVAEDGDIGRPLAGSGQRRIVGLGDVSKLPRLVVFG